MSVQKQSYVGTDVGWSIGTCIWHSTRDTHPRHSGVHLTTDPLSEFRILIFTGYYSADTKETSIKAKYAGIPNKWNTIMNKGLERYYGTITHIKISHTSKTFVLFQKYSLLFFWFWIRFKFFKRNLRMKIKIGVNKMKINI